MSHRITCPGCSQTRELKHRPTGTMCRTCAARLGSQAAACRVRPTVAERFETKVERLIDGCWIWIGNQASNGYGQLYVEGRQVIAHRLSYELHVGPLDPELEIDHLCNVRACVRPDHLEQVTHLENMRRRSSRAA